MGCIGSKATPEPESDPNPGNEHPPATTTAVKAPPQRAKILLLGAGESGKSTVAKQLKILFMGGFSNTELAMYRSQVHANVLANVRLLIKSAQTSGLTLRNERLAQTVSSPDYMTGDLLSSQAAADILEIWSDPVVKQIFARGAEFHLVESTDYFFQHLNRLVAPNYTPSNDDILRCRRLTVGAEELDFEISSVAYHVIDVGGQKGEREKWLDYFQNNNAVLFFVALSEYDQKLFEDNSTPRIQESLKLFGDVCNHQWFANAAVVLFLNKADLFREKLTRVPISVAFPDYSGPNDFDASAAFIQDKFFERVMNKNKKVYPFITNATSTDSFKNIFDSMHDVVVKQLNQGRGV
jgi:GTPase SAR1 family protein